MDSDSASAIVSKIRLGFVGGLGSASVVGSNFGLGSIGIWVALLQPDQISGSDYPKLAWISLSIPNLSGYFNRFLLISSISTSKHYHFMI